MYMDYPFGKFVTELFSIKEVARTLIRGLMLDVYVATFLLFSWSLQAEGREETFKGFHFSYCCTEVLQRAPSGCRATDGMQPNQS